MKLEGLVRLTSTGRGLWRHAGAGLVVSAAALLGSSCNALVDTDTEQCKTTTDCVAKGGEFANATCTDGVCSMGDCTSHSECTSRLGVPAICRQPGRNCVPLTATDCTEYFPADAVGDDSAVWIGFIGPLTGADASSGVPTWQGVKLALNEIQTNANGMPVKNGTERRRLAAIACDDANDAIAAATHLSHSLRLPAIIGPAFSSVTLDISNNVTIPGKSLLFSPSATSPAITNLQDSGLVWRTCPSDAIQAIPIARVVADLETKLSATTPTIKVAMAVLGDAYGTGLASAASSKLTFNGKLAVDQPAEFLRVDYPEQTTDFQPVADKIVAHAPDIVLYMGTTEAVTDILPKVVEKMGTTTPYHVFSDGGKIQELLDAVKANTALRTRVIGTAPGRTTLLYQQFKSSFKGFFNNEDPGAYAEHAYDAAYLTAFALVATSDQIPTGAMVNEGLKRTVGGTVKIPADPNQLNAGFSALLAEGSSINYDGVSGPLDFDPEKGEAPADIDVWCINTSNAFVSSGQFYNAVTGKVEGSTTNCN